MRGRGRGRGRSARGRRGGIARGRGKKNVKVIESDEEEVQQEVLVETQDENFPPVKIDLEADISQLEAPTFTTLNRGPPEPMLRLRWDHRVSLIGEKVLNPMIHCCDQCLKPILIYGRMIPCKHVFCLTCARREDKTCPRCMDSVTRVEQTGLGTVFMCTHGGTRYGNTGCRRTYLSQRDLQAHINHRHSVGGDSSPNKVSAPPPQSQQSQPPPPQQSRKLQQSNSQNDPRSESNTVQYRSQSRTNLITVPIQQDHTPQPQPPQYHQSVQQSGYSLGPPPPGQYGGYAGAAYYQQPPQYPPPPPPPTAPPPVPVPPPYQDQAQYWAPIHQFYSSLW